MNTGAIAPVRRAVPLRRGEGHKGRAALARLTGAEQLWLYGSGTDALQGVLAHCSAQAVGNERNQVILPAYGCPDLLTACIGAGLRPVLVDVDVQGWGYDLTALAAALSPRTLAVVAVNLLGIGDDASRIRPLLADPAVTLVQDSAQWLPRTASRWAGDFQIFSFGRGKPLNLLGGGAATAPLPPDSRSSQTLREWLLGSRLGALLFNVATAPPLYGLASSLPGLGLGTTRYRAPATLRAAPSRLALQLDAALSEWNERASYSAAPWQDKLANWHRHGITALGAAAGSPAPAEPLRLALLARSLRHRDALVSRLTAQGLGATSLYGTALHQVAGVPHVAAIQGPFPAADSLAQRLFTLPTHRDVTAATVERVDTILCGVGEG